MRWQAAYPTSENFCLVGPPPPPPPFKVICRGEEEGRSIGKKRSDTGGKGELFAGTVAAGSGTSKTYR